MQPIGYVRSPYKETQDIPKGLGAKHEAEGVLEIRPEFDLGLTDIEGFSHLFVIWVFDRSGGFELLGTPPSDTRTHGVFATRSPKRPQGFARRLKPPARECQDAVVGEVRQVIGERVSGVQIVF